MNSGREIRKKESYCNEIFQIPIGFIEIENEINEMNDEN